MMFKIVSAIHAHGGGPIRSLTTGPVGEIVSGCQSDNPNTRRFLLAGDNLEEIGSACFHDHWVVALTSLQPDQSRTVYPQGCVISGCQDSNIRIFDLEGIMCTMLQGHTKGVISFSWTPTSCRLLSGSWDGTARVWDLSNSSCVMTLPNHENGVHVLGLRNSTIVTVSTGESVNGKPANFRLRLWDEFTGQQIGSPIEDHGGSIRSVKAAASDLGGFITTGNDGCVILRSNDGQAMGTMFHAPQEDGSPPFVLDCTSLYSNGGDSTEIVSCGEDGSVMVWAGTELLQRIDHPNCVWCCLALPNTNGDFVTGCHDGVLRVFSRDDSRNAQPKAVMLQAEFEQEVAAAIAAKRKGPSEEEISKATKWEERGMHPGKSDQQVMVFNKDGKLVAAQWTAVSGSWVEIGEVTGSGDGGQVNGQWYDHVMPVEIDTPSGVRSLQLGHNDTENPFSAAQRFINENELDQAYLAQIADWIIARGGRSQAPTLGGGDGGAAALPPPTPAGFSGVGVPGGTTASHSSSAVSSTFATPIVGAFTFDNVPNCAKLLSKLKELNAAESQISAAAAISESDMTDVEHLVAVISDASHYHSSTVSSQQLRVMCNAATKYETLGSLFPILDVLKCVAVHPSGAETLAEAVNRPLLNALVGRLISLWASGNAVTLPYPTAMVSAQLAANLFRYDSLRNAVLQTTATSTSSSNNSALSNLLCGACALGKHNQKLVRAAVAALAMNLTAVVVGSAKYGGADFVATKWDDTEAVQYLLRLTHGMIQQETESDDVLLRLTNCVGTLAAHLLVSKGRSSSNSSTSVQAATIAMLGMNFIELFNSVPMAPQWSSANGNKLSDITRQRMLSATDVLKRL